MTELQEFIYLLHRHPEMYDQLRKIAEDAEKADREGGKNDD